MPRVDFESLPLAGAESWEKYYSGGYGPHLRPGAAQKFRALTVGPLHVGGVEQAPHPLTFSPTDRILIVGSGAGYLVAEFRDGGFPLCWGLDYSTVLEGSTGILPDGIAAATVWIDIGSPGGQVRAALRSVTGDDEFQWVITDDIAPCYNADAELDGLLGAAQAVLANGVNSDHVANIVTGLLPDAEQDPDFLWMSIDDWKTVRPAQTWIDIHGWEIR